MRYDAWLAIENFALAMGANEGCQSTRMILPVVGSGYRMGSSSFVSGASLKMYRGLSLRIELIGVSPVPIIVSGPRVNLPSVMAEVGDDRSNRER